MKNRYLDWIEKDAANAFTKKYRDGNLSQGSLARIQGANMVRGPDQMAAGINRGSESILKKEAPRFSIYEDPYEEPSSDLRKFKSSLLTHLRNTGGGGYVTVGGPLKKVLVPKSMNSSEQMLIDNHPDIISHTDPSLPVDDQHENLQPIAEKIFASKDFPGSSRLVDSVNRRHEVYEASESHNLKSGRPVLSKFIDHRTGETTGVHVNLAVIGRENNLTRGMVPSGPSSDMKSIFKNVREGSLEPRTQAWRDATGNSEYGSKHLTKRVLEKLREPHPSAQMETGSRIQSLVAGSLKKLKVARYTV